MREELVEKWTAIIEAARQHPGTVREYLRQNGHSVANYYYWHRRLHLVTDQRPKKRKIRRKKGKARSPFVAVAIKTVPEVSQDRLEIQLPGGASVFLPAGYETTQVAELLLRLEGRN